MAKVAAVQQAAWNELSGAAARLYTMDGKEVRNQPQLDQTSNIYGLSNINH
jgi:hypothetical protein